MDVNTCLAKFLSDKLDGITTQDALEAIVEFQKKNIHFTNKGVQQFWEENGEPEVLGSGPNGKVKMDDVRRAIGVETKTRTPDEFASNSARELAEEYGFSYKDFSEDLRSGSSTKTPLASGLLKRISVLDVRNLAVTKGVANDDETSKLYSSPGVAKLAKENGLSPSDFEIKGRPIKREDVKAYIAEMEKSSDNPFNN